MTTDLPRPRGRPRRFDPEAAIATAQRLFHARGFDAVSVADITGALGINPPSFYAAFGSKAGLYARVVERYDAAGAAFMGGVLDPGRPVAEALADLLERVARAYATDPAAAGCLVLEGRRCDDPGARDCAAAALAAAEETIRRYVAARHPREAQRVTDYVTVTMAGLSAKAREGQSEERLLAAARLAGSVLAGTLRDA